MTAVEESQKTNFFLLDPSTHSLRSWLRMTEMGLWYDFCWLFNKFINKFYKSLIMFDKKLVF